MIDGDLQTAFGLRATGNLPIAERPTQIHLIQEWPVADSLEHLTSFANPPFGQRRFKLTEIGFHARGIDRDPAVRSIQKIAPERCQSLIEAKQALTQARACLRLKTARPE